MSNSVSKWLITNHPIYRLYVYIYIHTECTQYIYILDYPCIWTVCYHLLALQGFILAKKTDARSSKTGIICKNESETWVNLGYHANSLLSSWFAYVSTTCIHSKIKTTDRLNPLSMQGTNGTPGKKKTCSSSKRKAEKFTDLTSPPRLEVGLWCYVRM